MPDIGSIATALSTIKTSIDIAKVIKDSNSSLNEAERNNKIADLINSLADVKIELGEVKDLLRNKDDEIRELKEKINEKESLKFDGKLYWKEGDKTPFCTVCFENNIKSVHLTYLSADQYLAERYKCNICKTIYYLR